MMSLFFQKVAEFWDTLGWLANAIEILVALAVIFLGIPKIYKKLKNSSSISNYKNVSDYVSSKLISEKEVLDVIKSKVRIAIVDDNIDDFPVDYLRRSGFSIDIYESLSLAEVNKLLPYSVVFLDIAGVVPEDIKSGGLSLIKKLKMYNQHPSIIAVSGKKFDPTVTEFFKLAEDVMKKPITEVECEEHLNDTLEQKCSPCKAAKEIDAYLNLVEFTSKEYAGLIKLLLSYIEGNIDEAKVESKIMKKYGVVDLDKVRGKVKIIKSWFRKDTETC